MKQLFILILTCQIMALPCLAQKDQPLKEVMSLEMPDGPGARCASIAWHPVLKRYYAPKSGNADYLMAIFDAKGKLVSPEGLKAMFDVRGFWYNNKLKTFCSNGYNDKGWVSYVLDNKGTPIDVKQLADSMAQPFDQSVGSYDAVNDLVYFLDGQKISFYKAATQKEIRSIRLHINYRNAKEESEDTDAVTDDSVTPENINTTVVIYTGIPRQEFALLDFKNSEIQLYSKNTGYMMKKLLLPPEAPVNEMLCFTYCNNFYWLFDQNTKIWRGYK